MKNDIKNLPSVTLFGIPILAVTMSEILSVLGKQIEKKESIQIGVVNAAKVVNMHRDKSLKEDVLSSDIILADGAAIVLASVFLRKPLPERVTGIDLMYELFQQGTGLGYRVYCLGATEAVSKTMEDKIKSDYPGLILAGRHNGYFTSKEEESIANDIAQSKADILLVAMTSPKKENFLARWSDTINVPICHGVGGSFDVMAGKVKRAPIFWQKMGMEWLYRVIQEPRRMWKRYLVTNTIFMWLLLKELGKKSLGRG